MGTAEQKSGNTGEDWGETLWPNEDGEEWSDLGYNLVTGLGNVLMRGREESRIPLVLGLPPGFLGFFVLFLVCWFFLACFVFVFLKLISWRRSDRT